MFYPFLFFKNKILSFKKASLAFNDLGFLRGLAIFDWLVVLNSRPIFLEDHLSRFKKAQEKFFKDEFKFSKERIKKIIFNLIKKNQIEEGAIRIIITGGKTFDGKNYFKKPDFFILGEKFKFMPFKIYQKGVKVITLNFQRPFPEIKTTFYFPLISEFKNLSQTKAFEPLYVFKNKVLESATSNFFIFKNNTLITPKKHILKGITRKKILNFARRCFKVEEREISLKEALRADEAFLTATGKGVLPIREIDGKIIGKVKNYKNTKKLFNFYFQLLRKESQNKKTLKDFWF